MINQGMRLCGVLAVLECEIALDVIQLARSHSLRLLFDNSLENWLDFSPFFFSLVSSARSLFVILFVRQSAMRNRRFFEILCERCTVCCVCFWEVGPHRFICASLTTR